MGAHLDEIDGGDAGEGAARCGRGLAYRSARSHLLRLRVGARVRVSFGARVRFEVRVRFKVRVSFGVRVRVSPGVESRSGFGVRDDRLRLGRLG